MENEIGICNELVDQRFIADIAVVDFDLALDMGDIGLRSCGQVIEDGDLISLGKQGIGEVRADKACSTGDEYAPG